MSYVATVNVPGYLPMDDEPPVFDTPGAAWGYLATERRDAEDNAEAADPNGADVTETSSYYSETVDQLDANESAGAGPGTVYGDTPGYDGDHDLGLAYCVTETEES
jgi:hypothetical protein